ncbi:MAG: M16 family metallopeptidase [Longimicrobiaceae bacterium]
MPEKSFRPLRIPARTQVLGNGMRIIAHEDHSSPVVNVHLMYHVGSKDESPGRTGLAHLLEHLLFEGSEHCPKGEFDLLLERVGGTNNGSTWLDRTNYYETVPSHAVELALWLERERMAHFRPVLGEEMLELQRGVVINERLQVIENRPYGRADEKLHEVLFPEAHPYRWPTIGYLEDLESIALDDVRSFHEGYYTPANAVLVLAGDVHAEEAFSLAERYFGDLPGPTEPRRVAPAPNGQPPRATQRELLEDRVSFPRVYRAHAVPPYGSADWIALDVLAYLLADGESSRLQRALVREGQLAQEVDSYLFPTELNGIFGVVATARSGVEAAALEEVIDRTLAKVVEEGVTEAEVAGAVRRVRRDQVEGLANVEDRAEALAYAATVLGEAEALERVMAGYLHVTPDDVQRVARRYLAPEEAATVVVVPGHEETDER